MEVLGTAYERIELKLDENGSNHLAQLMKMLKYTFMTGFVLGGWRGAHTSSLQFMAEHQHILAGIRTRREASAYFRLRNARVITGAAREGVRRGGQLAFVAAIFSGIKWTLSIARQRGVTFVDADELVAGMASGALFALGGSSIRQRLYHLRRGLLMGGIFGAGLLTLRIVTNGKDQE
jgi:hypothetical protein